MDRQRLRPVARQMLWHLRELAKLTDILPLSDTERAARRSHFAQMLNSVYELGSPETPPERIQQLAVKGFGLAQFYMIADREAIERMPPGPERERADRLASEGFISKPPGGSQDDLAQI